MEIVLSVREFVEFMLRSGDIDNRGIGSPEDAMLEGARIHRMIQKRMGSEYEAEVPLSFTAEYPDYTIRIDGRADGIIHKDGKVVIDEIKTTYRELETLGDPPIVHLAQARCYAYMVARDEELDEIGVRMTYCNIKSLKIQYFHENHTRQELTAWFEDILEQYRKWAEFSCKWRQERKESIGPLAFPYRFREGQRELAGQVYQTIKNKRKLFIQAPTGVGKTLSCVYPAIKSIGEECADKLFYLTAKTITASVARETFSLLRAEGLKAKVLSVTAKEKICPLEEMECNPDACPYAKGHFDRINDAVYELLTTEDEFDRDRILEAAKEHMVCPFEMSLDMSLFSDVVICDYNYLFDPYVKLKRFFAQGVRGPYLFLVDEAHNLLERGQKMYSAEIVKEDILALRKEIRGSRTKLGRYLDRANRKLLELKKTAIGEVSPVDTEPVHQAFMKLYGEMAEFLENAPADHPAREAVLDFYFLLKRYMDVLERYDENYLTYTEMRHDGSFVIHLLCVDPSDQLKACFEQGVSSILFSATLLPIQYYKGLLGGTEEDYEVYARTSFSEKQFRLMLARDVTSKYTERGLTMYRRIASYIKEITQAKPGNYMIFCPSHLFLQEVCAVYEQSFYDPDSEEMLVQESEMKEELREAFLQRFMPDSANLLPDNAIQTKSILGFCVLGGIFSEGIDLKGESLIGAIVVGTGLPQISMERDLLRGYFDRHDKDGFDYAYRFPGMNKVLQAAGRVIRTVEDRGIIALLDYRFCQPSYTKLFPREWRDPRFVTAETVALETESFWSDLSE